MKNIIVTCKEVLSSIVEGGTSTMALNTYTMSKDRQIFNTIIYNCRTIDVSIYDSNQLEGSKN